MHKLLPRAPVSLQEHLLPLVSFLPLLLRAWLQGVLVAVRTEGGGLKTLEAQALFSLAV